MIDQLTAIIADVPVGLIIVGQLVLLPVLVACLTLLLRQSPARAHTLILAGLFAILAAPLLTLLAHRFGLGQLPGLELAPVGAAPLVMESGDDGASRATVGLWPILLAAWGVSTLVLAVRLGLGLARGVGIARSASPCPDDHVVDALTRVVRHLPPRRARRIQLYQTNALESPAIFCWGRVARILLPAKLELGSDERDLELMLGHEVAHFVRRDHAWRFIAEVAVCLLPWHPVIWWLRWAVYETSEMACDARVVKRDKEPERYAEMLLRLLPCRSVQLPALHAVRARSTLSRRIRRVLQDRDQTDRSSRAWMTTVAFASIALLSIVALAQPRPPQLDLPEMLGDADRPEFAISAVPNIVDLGTVPPAGTAEGKVRLVNVGTASLTYTNAKASCGCTTLEQIDSFTMPPGHVLTVPISLDGPEEAETERVRKITFFFEELPPLEVQVKLTTTAG